MTMAMLILRSRLVSIICRFRRVAPVRLCTRHDMVACGSADEYRFRLHPAPCRRRQKVDVNRIVFRVSKGLSVDVVFDRALRCARSVCRFGLAFPSDSTFHVDADTGRFASETIRCKRNTDEQHNG